MGVLLCGFILHSNQLKSSRELLQRDSDLDLRKVRAHPLVLPCAERQMRRMRQFRDIWIERCRMGELQLRSSSIAGFSPPSAMASTSSWAEVLASALSAAVRPIAIVSCAATMSR